jgi:hypothetical protein
VIQQVVQQALASHQPASHGQAPAKSHASEDERPTGPEDWCALHQVAMERRSHARGAWRSHGIASEQRSCKGKA